ncbi:MAG TPA: hypothetical protein VJR30_10475 [Bradyrhizobium sp.]|nr:hypothetical protein [Bradyrhizobium sp.]
MKRARAVAVDVTGRGGAMKNLRYIGLHAVAAAAFVFVLQRFILGASLESSLLWAFVFGAAAAGLAYSQANR